MPLYSRMTADELEAEMRQLQKGGQAAFDEQNWSEYEILMKKWYIAKSYSILDTFHIQLGATYTLTEEPDDTLTITKTEGVMAWGIRRSSGLEVAVPIAMLADKQPD